MASFMDWWDRNGMSIVSLAAALLLYFFGHQVGVDDQVKNLIVGGLTGASGGLKLDGVWSRKNVLAQ